MSVAAYTALHYGSPYLGAAIRSVIDSVDSYYILYAARGSHGTRNGRKLPASESKFELYRIAYEVAGDKLVWIDGDWTVEGNQRDSIYDYAKRAEVILVVDYDEIWPESAPQQAIQQARSGAAGGYRLPMIHYWRSFRRAILHDPAYPVRVLVPGKTGEDYIHTAPLNHLGYAIPTWLVEYKLSIHGHIGQFRTDVNWLEDRWKANAQFDCHPVGSEYWNPELIDPLAYQVPMWSPPIKHKVKTIEKGTFAWWMKKAIGEPKKKYLIGHDDYKEKERMGSNI